MFVAMADPKTFAEAQKKSEEEYNWGPLYVASCMWGAFDFAFALSGKFTVDMIGDEAAYDAVAPGLLDKYHIGVGSFCVAASLIVELAREGACDFFIKFMDNTPLGGQTTWLMVRAADMLTVSAMERSGGALGISLENFNAVYPTSAYVLATLAKKMYDIGGRIPKRLHSRLTGARQTHHLGMTHMLQYLSSKGGAHVKEKKELWPDPFWWLSLFGGLTCIVGVVTVVGKELRRDVVEKLEAAGVTVIHDTETGQTAAVARPYDDQEKIAGRPNFRLPETVAELRDGATDLAEHRGDLPSLADPDDDKLQGPKGLGGVGVVLREEIREEAGLARPQDPARR